MQQNREIPEENARYSMTAQRKTCHFAQHALALVAVAVPVFKHAGKSGSWIRLPEWVGSRNTPLR